MLTISRINGQCVTACFVIFTFIAGANPRVEAAFHLWQIQEVFTNASGSVQFIELWDNNPGETFMAGKTVTATVGSTTKTFAFPSDPNKDADAQRA